jgi:hypothetical protein
VDVGFGDGDDLHAVLLGQVLVHRDVPAAVDHHGRSVRLAADQVAGLCEVFIVNALDKHL